MTKTIMAGAVAMALVSFGANAANQGHGVVNFKGTVINAPCGIAPESVDQSIDFGQISKTHLDANGISVKKDLNIKLVNCEPDKNVTVTFTGATIAGAANELGTAGDTGTAVVISGQDGKLVSFGKAGDALSLKEGDNTLHYSSWVKKATGGTLKEGDFSAVANFNLTYQ
ncbi:TPA: type 1 fimbrial protein [Salmonella enterica subsp. enterica serovar Mississippi]|nr:type 1 fimbrial protein [Salmonella enterica subsp. enterica]ECW0788958.1 type 1 fimbrial protein [Salmonella enterica subsp. enterica]HED0168019.1 type 1 fimbrial protein [Salmonella enterica subsp. enterica serovar Mississippi]HED0173883.1 type 1 fimbrial protein [Salmonella enterica subsp. enterica serovar Mississippi]HED0195878.1 type 1 fimbrial protein [Salmonella enterica subsp. enterica serovar Mississippi]